ncbi:MAG TPA: extracellular solute-binding protein [Chloroflexota bacterium]|nr:extracellular solute-binding protein [Chloroflexota bacterium]
MTRVSRRCLLSWTLIGGAVASGSALLAACSSPVAVPSPTSQPSAPVPAAAPTVATTSSAPTATPVGTVTTAPSSVTAAGPVFAPTSAAVSGIPGPELVAKPPQKSPITLRFHMRTGGDKSEPAIYVDRPGEWMQQTGHKIMLEPIPGDQNYVPKVLVLAASGTIGDLLFTGNSYGEHVHLVHSGIIAPIDDYLATYKLNKAEWFKTIVDTLTFNGKMYGLPKAANPAESFVTINLEMLDKAGIPRPPVYGVTFDQIRQWAIQLTKGPPDRRDVYGYYTVVNSNQSVTNGVRQRGGDLVASDGEHSLVDQQPFQDWLNWNYQLIVKDKVHPLGGVVTQGDSNAIAAMFAAGKLAMAHSHRAWQFPIRNAVKDKFAWTNIQYPRGANARGWVSNIDTHSMTATTKYMDEAFTLCYALADRRFAYLVAKTQGYLTGRVDNLEDLGDLKNDPFLQLQQTNTEQEEPWWQAKNGRAYEVESVLKNTLDLVWLGKRGPDKSFINDLKQGIDAVLAKPQA